MAARQTHATNRFRAHLLDAERGHGTTGRFDRSNGSKGRMITAVLSEVEAGSGTLPGPRRTFSETAASPTAEESDKGSNELVALVTETPSPEHIHLVMTEDDGRTVIDAGR